MAKPVEYNRSPNASRDFTVLRRTCDGSGRTRILIDCPFCRSHSWAYVWSIAGGGKKCENKKCGAKFSSFGETYPVAGREPS